MESEETVVGSYRILALCSLVQILGSWNLVNCSVFLNEWTHALTHASNTQLMLIFSLQDATFCVFGPAVAPIAERIGYRWTILLGLLLLSAGYAGAGALNLRSVWAMLFWLGFLIGLGAALICIGAAGLSALFLTDQRRLWSVMITVSQTVGAAVRVPALRALLDRFGPFNALLVWSLVLLITVGTVPFLREPPKIEDNESATTVRETITLWTVPFTIFLVGMALMSSFCAARDLSPKYAESELGMSGQWSAWAASIGQMASLGAVLLLLALTRFVHTDGVMLSAVLAIAFSSVSLALTSDERVFVALLSLLGASFSVAWALFPAALAERVSNAGQVPRAYGAAYSTWALGSAGWRAISGMLMDATGTIRAYYLLSGVLLVGACIAFAMSLLCRRRSSESQVALDVLLRESDM